MNLNEYKDFVDSVTSEASKNNQQLVSRINDLSNQGVNVSRLLTASVGMSGEVGEFNDLVKKVIFQEKPMTPELHDKLIKECGDIFWYVIQAVIAIGQDPYQVIDRNVQKLSNRYTNGVFNVTESENRKASDD